MVILRQFCRILANHKLRIMKISQQLSLLIVFVLFFSGLQAQYEFKEEKRVQCSEIKNQQRTGTCWSFATSSFIESELKRKGLDVDVSEMFIVRKVYEDKAFNYVMRQGKANFSQGSLSHDLMRTVAREGIVPEKNYMGRKSVQESFNHTEMEKGLKGFLDGVIAAKHPTNKWRKAVSAVLDVYLGKVPQDFKINGKKYNAIALRDMLQLKDEEFVSLTSFTHHPFYSDFILEIPDNYSNGKFKNVPLDELKSIVDHALSKGYSIAWDGDVSEKGFSHKNGIAILPVDNKREDLFTVPGEEIKVTQSVRQEAFESWSTTDDHLMHLVGKSVDQDGTAYYLIKNSWGDENQHEGYLYMSESYFLMKTVAIMVNKNGLPDQTKKLYSYTDE